MGKNRKKPRGKGLKNKRYALHSNASVNTGPTPVNPGSGRKAPSGLLQVGVAEYKERAASIGKPEVPLRNRFDQALVNERVIRNETSLVYLREMWKGTRRQGITEFYCELVTHIRYTYRLALLFSGRRFIWMCEDWRTEKRKFSIIYGSRERAFQVKDSERGITWELEDALNPSERYANVVAPIRSSNGLAEDIVTSFQKAVTKN